MLDLDGRLALAARGSRPGESQLRPGRGLSLDIETSERIVIRNYDSLACRHVHFPLDSPSASLAAFKATLRIQRLGFGSSAAFAARSIRILSSSLTLTL